jgi:hypothetical protein
MKVALLFAVLAVAGFAHAQNAVVTISGDEAKAKWEEILPNATVIENTVSLTIIQSGNVTCSLLGSHGGSAAALGGEQYTCDIAP